MEYPDFIESTGYGTGDGLCGWNCRHHFQPWAEGLRNPWRDENGNLLDGNGNRIDNEANKKRYELIQRQRAMERAIRKTKRLLIVKQEQIDNPIDADIKKLQSDYDKIAYDLTQQNEKYNKFCADNDLQPQYDRIKVADFGRQQSKQANAGAKRHQDLR